MPLASFVLQLELGSTVFGSEHMHIISTTRGTRLMERGTPKSGRGTRWGGWPLLGTWCFSTKVGGLCGQPLCEGWGGHPSMSECPTHLKASDSWVWTRLGMPSHVHG